MESQLPPLVVRPFRQADAGALATLFHLSVHQVGSRHYAAAQVAAWSPSPPDPRRYVEQAADRTMLVATDAAGTIAGYGTLEADGHIDHLYSHPERVGVGAGSALCAELEAVARRTGITLLVVEASEGARRFFERRGFTLDARQAFTLRGVTLHNYRMTKRVG